MNLEMKFNTFVHEMKVRLELDIKQLEHFQARLKNHSLNGVPQIEL